MDRVCAATVTNVPEHSPSRPVIDDVLTAGFLDGISSWSLDEVRARKHECQELENSVSFARRVVQARLEILRAESSRRRSGGSIADLVAALPTILGSEGPRSGVATTRFPNEFSPDLDDQAATELDSVINDTALAELPDLSTDELAQRIAHLEAFERTVSDQRSSLHTIIDQLDQHIVERNSRA